MKKVFRFFVVFTIMMGAFAMITNTGEVQAARIPEDNEEENSKTRVAAECDNVLKPGSTAVFGANAGSGNTFYHTFTNYYSSSNSNVYNPVVSPSALPKLNLQMHLGNEFSIPHVFTVKQYNSSTGQVYVSTQYGGLQFWAYPTYMIETIPGSGTKTCVSSYQ